jgi:predicted hydrocarbon binding protein
MAELKIEHKFDPKRKRHYLNNFLTVLHYHHYATLFTQLALDAKDLVDETQILKETIEDVFFEVLSGYYKKNGITDTKERMDIASQMFSAVGMGKMDIVSGDDNGGEIEMPLAYVDEGWIKKWGKFKEPVNYIGAGYVCGMFAAVFDKPLRTYNVTETQSRVMGADKSHFKVSI